LLSRLLSVLVLNEYKILSLIRARHLTMLNKKSAKCFAIVLSIKSVDEPSIG
jgi:hypothetical protein